MKKSLLILGPVSSRSGYGDHARDVALSFIDLEPRALSIISVPIPAGSPNEIIRVF